MYSPDILYKEGGGVCSCVWLLFTCFFHFVLKPSLLSLTLV